MTFLSDILFGDSSKKIYKKDFNKALKQASGISDQERKYLNEVFKKDLEDGLSAYEIKQRIEKLRHISDDSLESDEVEQVRKKLMEGFKK